VAVAQAPVVALVTRGKIKFALQLDRGLASQGAVVRSAHGALYIILDGEVAVVLGPPSSFVSRFWTKNAHTAPCKLLKSDTPLPPV
jgi:hypothetical protein